MNSIPFHSSLLLLPSVSSSIQKPQWKAQKLLWSSSKEPKHNQKMTARTGAIAESLFLGVASEPRPRDVSVLLQTGAVLLLAYGIANFIFPAFISNYYEFDKVSEDMNPNEAADPSDEAADSSDDEADPSDDD
ncbi:TRANSMEMBRANE PROTEIN [Salix purpurea]|uniref:TRANSMEMBRANE PROTEIN n=1 Tax=Salix purpurea TaxID=77065 RepID=A0A9Q0WGM2_SALPP|nr:TRANSMEMBRANE PROTEIN [Salix purpurea]